MNKIKNFVMEFNLRELVENGENKLKASNNIRILEEVWHRINNYWDLIPLYANFELYISKENEYILFFELVAGRNDDNSNYPIKLIDNGTREDVLSLTNEQLWNMIVERL